MLYREILPVPRAEAERARARKDPELYRIVVAVGLYEPDGTWAESFCLDLAASPNPFIRGNALVSLGHLARRFGRVAPAALPLVAAGLTDENAHVRDQAESAAADIERFTPDRVRS